ncbi:MAG TPA: hypothetical protein VGR53_06765 [Nitrososphaerales archaeon]|nr:hypothetical protein [Nitrososphaerales archaeon]
MDRVSITVSFVGSNPSSLGAGNWISGGISTQSGTHCNCPWDIGFSFYAYLDSSGNMGVAWYVVATCEFPPLCGSYGTDQVIAFNSAVNPINGIPANYATDSFILTLYWYANGGNPLYIFDVKDPNLSPYAWTIASPSVPSYALNQFSYGVDISCPASGVSCNPPYSSSYAYQMGVSSNIRPQSASLLVSLTNPSYSVSGTVYSPGHAATIGAQQELAGCPDGAICSYLPDTWWHDNWAWGSYQNQPPENPASLAMTTVESTPIDSLQASQVNTQSFTASSSYRTICVTVSNYAGIQSSADSAGQGGIQIGLWIANHPWADGTYWTVLTSSSCTNLTWIYAGAYMVPDNTQLW